MAANSKNDKIVPLAVSMQRQPGVYALLLGSGVSRSAKVPTGWEVVLELIQTMADSLNQTIDENPEDWFREKYGKDAGYSSIIDHLASTPQERQGILKPYFEPTEEERADGIKQPTPAHHAIAELMAQGYVRVVLTTNFDRLLENALREKGVEPVVVSSEDQVAGMEPLSHQKCLIVKLHGDYLDSRMRNTAGELEEYPENLNRLLDRILDEFGLVICGWSGEWDPALRKALERCPTRRYSTYWCSLGPMSESTEQLFQCRDANLLEIEGADSFFPTLKDMVVGLDERKNAAPDSKEAMIALTKRYVSDPAKSVALEDLLRDEVDEVRAGLLELWKEDRRKETFLGNVTERVEAILDKLVNALVRGVAHGRSEHTRLWTDVLRGVVGIVPKEGDVKMIYNLSYSLPYLAYAAGITALHREKWDALAAVLLKPEFPKQPAYLGQPMVPWPCAYNWIKWCELFSKQLDILELGKHLCETLQEPLSHVFPDQQTYETCFDHFELLVSMVHADICQRTDEDEWRTHPRRRIINHPVALRMGVPYAWQILTHPDPTEVKELLNVGFFRGSKERFEEVRVGVHDTIMHRKG
jgi:hypothetical protein